MASLDRIITRDDTRTPDFVNDNQLVFRASFDANVNNVTVDDFVITGNSGATIRSLEGVNTAGGTNSQQYDIVVELANLPAFTGQIGIALAQNQDIVDAGNNTPVPTQAPTGRNDSYDLVGSAPPSTPSITSITRQNPGDATTGADSLTFRVTFSEDVQNVNADDFEVNGTTATVTAVVPVSNSIYDVTVSGGDLATLNGTVSLALAQGQNITSLLNVAVPVAAPTGSNETYAVAIDTTAPVLNSIERERPNAATTSDDVLVFQATFNEAVQNVDANDFVINGNTTATITDVTAVDGSTYNITVSGGNLASFNGSVGLDLANAQDITDLAGNDLTAGEPATDEVYTVSNRSRPTSKSGILTASKDVLEITQLGDAEALSFKLDLSNVSSSATLRIFDNNSGVIDSFSVIENKNNALPGFQPTFNLLSSELTNVTSIKVELEEKGVKSFGSFATSNDGSVSLVFEDKTQFNVNLSTIAPTANLLKGNDAEFIDLGNFTGEVTISGSIYREAALDNVVGFYKVGANGAVMDSMGNMLMPGDTGYQKVALDNRLDINLSGTNGKEETFNATLTAGMQLGIFIAVDGVDLDTAKAGDILFSYSGANAGGLDHIRQVGDNAFSAEDQVGLGDGDYNDILITYNIA